MAKKRTKTNSISACVGFSEEYLSEFNSYYLSQEAKRISGMLNDRTTHMKPNAGSYRQINSWDKYGLIDIDRVGNEWRKYSIVDGMWLNIIAELRNFAIAIENIKKAKETLEEAGSKRSPMPTLEFCVYKALLFREHIFLLVFADGSAMPLPINEYNLNLITGELKNHIRIDLTEILLRLFENNEGLKPLYPAFEIKKK
ncbi:MAG: hypothetical protein ACJ77K_16095 [Bacteroidia bacterium]|jgi:DNA-binding transcriptional MerR regulator